MRSYESIIAHSQPRLTLEQQNAELRARLDNIVKLIDAPRPHTAEWWRALEKESGWRSKQE